MYFIMISEFCLTWWKNSALERFQLSGELESPGSQISLDLRLGVDSLTELHQSLRPLLGFLPGVGAQGLHQLEVRSLVVREPRHVTELRHQVHRTSLTRALLTDLAEILR